MTRRYEVEEPRDTGRPVYVVTEDGRPIGVHTLRRDAIKARDALRAETVQADHDACRVVRRDGRSNPVHRAPDGTEHGTSTTPETHYERMPCGCPLDSGCSGWHPTEADR